MYNCIFTVSSLAYIWSGPGGFRVCFEFVFEEVRRTEYTQTHLCRGVVFAPALITFDWLRNICTQSTHTQLK